MDLDALRTRRWQGGLKAAPVASPLSLPASADPPVRWDFLVHILNVPISRPDVSPRPGTHSCVGVELLSGAASTSCRASLTPGPRWTAARSPFAQVARLVGLSARSDFGTLAADHDRVGTQERPPSRPQDTNRDHPGASPHVDREGGRSQTGRPDVARMGRRLPVRRDPGASVWGSRRRPPCQHRIPEVRPRVAPAASSWRRPGVPGCSSATRPAKSVYWSWLSPIVMDTAFNLRQPKLTAF